MRNYYLHVFLEITQIFTYVISPVLYESVYMEAKSVDPRGGIMNNEMAITLKCEELISGFKF